MHILMGVGSWGLTGCVCGCGDVGMWVETEMVETEMVETEMGSCMGDGVGIGREGDWMGDGKRVERKREEIWGGTCCF